MKLNPSVKFLIPLHIPRVSSTQIRGSKTGLKLTPLIYFYQVSQGGLRTNNCDARTDSGSPHAP